MAEEITIAFAPTVLAEQLIHLAWSAGTALRTLLTGADVLHRHPAAGLPFALVNNYGPTECTVVATSGRVHPAQGEGTPSIGRPIADTTALVLDESLQPVAPRDAGELCLAGTLVGRGYRNDPELTASRFVTPHRDSGPPLRVYRTGDQVRLLTTAMAFLGRLWRIKLRGFGSSLRSSLRSTAPVAWRRAPWWPAAGPTASPNSSRTSCPRRVRHPPRRSCATSSPHGCPTT